MHAISPIRCPRVPCGRISWSRAPCGRINYSRAPCGRISCSRAPCGRINCSRAPCGLIGCSRAPCGLISCSRAPRGRICCPGLPGAQPAVPGHPGKLSPAAVLPGTHPSPTRLATPPCTRQSPLTQPRSQVHQELALVSGCVTTQPHPVSANILMINNISSFILSNR